MSRPAREERQPFRFLRCRPLAPRCPSLSRAVRFLVAGPAPKRLRPSPRPLLRRPGTPPVAWSLLGPLQNEQMMVAAFFGFELFRGLALGGVADFELIVLDLDDPLRLGARAERTFRHRHRESNRTFLGIQRVLHDKFAAGAVERNRLLGDG